MAKKETLDELRAREKALLARFKDRPITKETKRHIKRALSRVQKQIKEMSP